MKQTHLTTMALVLAGSLSLPAYAQEFTAGEPLGSINEAGTKMTMSDNVKVYGSFNFTESCTFDANKNLILAMNAGNRAEGAEQDGFVSLINPDGSVHTAKWIGATRDGLELDNPLGSAIQGDYLYTVDVGYLRALDLATGEPLGSIEIPGLPFSMALPCAMTAPPIFPILVIPSYYTVDPLGEISVFAEGGSSKCSQRRCHG